MVALSDSVNSILVPKAFMKWSNLNILPAITRHLHLQESISKQQMPITHKLHFIFRSKGYHLNKDNNKIRRLKSTLQNIVSALGIFGILVIIMALMLFSFYLQLMIAKSKDNLRLLITLGYSPKWLAESVAKTWLPMYYFTYNFCA